MDHRPEKVGMDSPMTQATKIVKGKSKLQDQEEEAEAERVAYKECRTLHVEIHNTEGIDRDSIENPSPDPFNYDMRVYTVLAELGPGVGFTTRREQGLPDPNWLSWRMVNMLPLYDDMETRYLYVEVVKFESRQDPGPSRGQRVVGRVAIPLPKKAVGDRKDAVDDHNDAVDDHNDAVVERIDELFEHLDARDDEFFNDDDQNDQFLTS